MENRHGFSAVCRVISVSGLIATLYIVIKLIHGQSDFIFPTILMICGLAVCCLNIIFTKKERTLGSICAFNAVMFGIFLFATIISGCLNETFSYPYAIISFFLLIIYCAVSVVNIPKLSGSIVCFDGAVLMLILVCLYVNVSHYSYSYTVFSIIGSFAGLLGLIAYRTSYSNGRREWGLIIILFLFIALISWMLFTFVVSPLSSGFELAGGTIALAFTYLGSMFSRFFRFLAGLIETDENSTGSINIEASSSNAGQETYDYVQNGGFPVVIIGLILAAAVIIIAVLIIKQRKNRIKINRQSIFSGRTRQKDADLKKAAVILINKIKRFMSARRYLKINKNRAEGVYFQLIKITKHTAFEKKEGETVSEFLLKLKTLLAVCGYDTLCFDSLIPAVNNNFYGRFPDEREFRQTAELKRNIKKATCNKASSTLLEEAIR